MSKYLYCRNSPRSPKYLGERVNFGKSLYYSITYKNKFDIDSLIPFEAKLLQTAHFALKFLTNPHPLSRKVAGWETINV
jgi:hypothetical protein